jgi:Magnesium chelatase, subunit ChlI
MAELVSSVIERMRPMEPRTLEATGLSVDLVIDLLLKSLHRTTELSGTELARRLGLSFAIVGPALEILKVQHLCTITGGPSLGGPSFRYRLTEQGHAHALRAMERNQYVGLAPVSVEQYVAYTDEFRRTVPRTVTPTQVRDAFAHLVVNDRVLDEIGPAVNSGHSIFMHGPPGNGKTVMSQAIRALLAGTIAIPNAIEIDGNIVRFFDPTVHEPIPKPDQEDHDSPHDPRWIECRRPMVAVGGELTLEALSLIYNPRTQIYRAPVQMLANGGVLLIDEFGRQRCHPRDLLNWWMVPLESGFETLSLQSGEKIELPFFPLVIFATNLRPSELVDEAFLRRIQYKIYADNPSPEEFARIFRIACADRTIPFEPVLVDHILERVYRRRGIELRGCHPRDLVKQALSLASYRGWPRRLTAELLEEACASYFIEEQAPRSPS